ncbi:MAG: sigma-70 family RNA polymerase sigma factor [Pseudomonadota bacterium]
MADPALTTFIKEREVLISVALRVVRSRAVAEELVQDSWLRWAHKNYPSDKALPIFRRIVSNLAKDWTRSNRTEEQILFDLKLYEDVDVDSERIVIARQELLRVVRVLESLPEKTVTAFRLRLVDGLTFTEIGTRLNLSRFRAHGLVKHALAVVTCVLKD